MAAAAAGRGQFLLLAGEAGIGKSRLIASIERTARAAGFETAAGLVAPQDIDVPAASLLDLARTMARMPRFAELGLALLAIAEEATTAAQQRRRVLVLRSVDLITGSLTGPLLLSFDDLQWADDISLEILTELARATRQRPLMLVGAYRSDEVAAGSMLRQWRSRLLSQRMAEEARLAPLTLEQTAQMTSVILATGLPAPGDIVEAVYERTDGIPLHIEELLGALGDDERTDSRAIREAAVPETLEDAILQRIGRLSTSAQEVARSGAVIGRCFVPDVLAGIMNVPADALTDPLRELVETRRHPAPRRARPIRLPPPAAPRRALPDHPADRPAALPCPRRRVRPGARRRVRGARLAPLRACGDADGGVPLGAQRRPRGSEAGRPSRGVRAVPPGHRQPAGGGAGRGARPDPRGSGGRGGLGRRSRRLDGVGNGSCGSVPGGGGRRGRPVDADGPAGRPPPGCVAARGALRRDRRRPGRARRASGRPGRA